MPLTSIPLVFAILFGLLQMVPLRGDLLDVLSPTSAELWEPVVSPTTGGMETPPAKTAAPLSLYPASTRQNVALISLATAVFFLGAHFFASRAAQFWLWTSIAFNGAALAVFGIIQQLNWNGKLYWIIQPTQVTKAFGPYVNHNNAAGYLNMCLAGTVALLFLGPLRNRGADDADDVGLSRRLRSGRGGSVAVQLVWLLLAGTIVSGIICSLSRGAFVSTVAAGLVTLAIMIVVQRNLKQIWLIGTTLLVAALLVGWLGMAETVQTRLGSLLDQHAKPDERLVHWRETLTAVPDFWFVGSGLGTYRYIYRYYEKRVGEEWFFHAENQYLEALIEGGIVGLSLLLMAMVLTAAAALHLARRETSRAGRAFGLAAVFAVTTQYVHGVFDFGLYLPANMLLFALICGAITGRACRWLPSTYRLTSFVELRSLRSATLIVFAMSVQCLFPLVEIGSIAAGESARTKVQALDQNASLEAREAAIHEFSRAVQMRADDAEAQRRLAQMWIDQYRRQARHRLKGIPFSSADADMSKLTDVSLLRRRAHELIKMGDRDELQQLRQTPLIRNHLRPALNHLLVARQSCPIMPQAHFRLAELCFLVQDPAAEVEYLQPLADMAQRKPELAYRAGLMHFDAGRDDRAVHFWRASLSSSSQFAEEIRRLSRKRSDVAALLFP